MFGFFCIGFIGFMLKGQSLLDHINLFPPKESEESNNIILKYLQYLKKYFCEYIFERLGYKNLFY